MIFRWYATSMLSRYTLLLRRQAYSSIIRVQSNKLKRWNTLQQHCIYATTYLPCQHLIWASLRYNRVWHSCLWAECASVKLNQHWQVLRADGSPIFPLFTVLFILPAALLFSLIESESVKKQCILSLFNSWTSIPLTEDTLTGSCLYFTGPMTFQRNWKK